MAVTSPDGSYGGTSKYFQKLMENRYKNPYVASGNTGTIAAKAEVDPRITQRAQTSTGAVIPTYKPQNNNANAEVAEPVYTTPDAGSGTVAVNSAINDLKSMYAAELAKREKEAEERQAQLAAQQLALKNQRDAEINAAYNNSKNLLGTEKDNALAKAYTAYMQGRKNMPQIAAVGGNGGIAQSILAKQQLNYENNRNAVEQKYLEDLMQLDASKNAGLTASTEAYTTGLMGLQSNSQDYLDNLRALQNDVTGYAGQMETLLNKLNNKVTTATATPKLTGYKVGGKTMSKEEYLAYLANLGMNAEEAYDFMKNNNILY